MVNNSSFSDDIVRVIIIDYESGMNLRQVCEKYGIARETLKNILIDNGIGIMYNRDTVSTTNAHKQSLLSQRKKKLSDRDKMLRPKINPIYVRTKEQDELVVSMYKQGYTMRSIARQIGTNHHRIKDILVDYGIKIIHGSRKYKDKVVTDDERKRLREGIAKREAKRDASWNPKITTNLLPDQKRRKARILNIIHHRRYFTLDYEFVDKFDDVDRFVFLGSLLRKRYYGCKTTEDFKKAIVKFYDDESFVRLYKLYTETGDTYIKPSLDHIIPLSKGGKDEIDNIRIISWFENKTKSAIDPDKWEEMKKNIYYYL